MNGQRRHFGEQFELGLKTREDFAAESGRPVAELVIDQLRMRLRKAQAAQFKAEAQLAIVTEERNKLAARLKEIAGSVYKIWRDLAGQANNASTRR